MPRCPCSGTPCSPVSLPRPAPDPPSPLAAATRSPTDPDPAKSARNRNASLTALRQKLHQPKRPDLCASLTLTGTHSLTSWSHVATSSARRVFPSCRDAVTWKWRQPKVLSIAVHVDPTTRRESNVLRLWKPPLHEGNSLDVRGWKESHCSAPRQWMSSSGRRALAFPASLSLRRLDIRRCLLRCIGCTVPQPSPRARLAQALGSAMRHGGTLSAPSSWQWVGARGRRSKI